MVPAGTHSGEFKIEDHEKFAWYTRISSINSNSPKPPRSSSFDIERWSRSWLSRFQILINLPKVDSSDFLTSLNTVFTTIKIDITIQKWIFSDTIHSFKSWAHNFWQANTLFPFKKSVWKDPSLHWFTKMDVIWIDDFDHRLCSNEFLISNIFWKFPFDFLKLFVTEDTSIFVPKSISLFQCQKLIFYEVIIRSYVILRPFSLII